MAVDLLLREGRVNGMTTKNRIHCGPAERNMANRDGSMNQRYINYLVARAEGGAGMITVEASYVDTRGMGSLYQVGVHQDRVIGGLRRMAEAVHSAGSKVGLEIYMGGRQSPSYMSQRQPIAPSVVRCEVLDPVPTPREMTQEDIKEVVQKFADGARRMKEAGLDYVLLHGAHGYLIGSFLSPYSNKRTDQYGGSPDNRARFPLEIVRAVREVVGPDWPIGYRISAQEYVDGGLTIEDTTKFCQELVRTGVDWIDTSGSIYETDFMTSQGSEAPKGSFVREARAIKDAVGDDAMVSATGRLNDPHFANEVMRTAGLDYVSVTRAFIADPEYGMKVTEGRFDDINHCISCHQCLNLLAMNKTVQCTVNVVTGFEGERIVHKVARPRNVMVVGGGPGGMEAARLLAEAGNRVTLYEKGPELGGQMLYSAKGASDYGYFAPYLERQLDKLKVNVKLNTPVTYDMVSQENPDAVVVATGSLPGLRWCPVVGNPTTFDVFTALDRPDDDWEEEVVVVGGDFAVCFAALYVAGRGAEVTIVEPNSTICYDKLSPARDYLIKVMTDLPTVHVRTESTVEEVGEGYVLIQHAGQIKRKETGSTIFGGRMPNNALYDEITMRDPQREAYNIGDSVEPRLVFEATHEAWEAAELIGSRAT